MSGRTGDEGWLVNAWGAVFQALKWISVFGIFRGLVGSVLRALGVRLDAKWDSPLVDIWVLANLFLAAAATVLASVYQTWSVLGAIVVIYGCYRVAEIVIVQINVLIFDPYRGNQNFLAGRKPEPYHLKGRYRTLVLFMHNYAEVALWIAAASIKLNRDIGEGMFAVAAIPTVLAKSLAMLATLNDEAILPGSGIYWTTLTMGQSLIGAILTLVLLARFVSLLPVPRSMDEVRPPSNETET